MASEATRTERLAAILQHNQVIASIKDDAGLERMLASRSRLGFLLYGTINSLPEQLRAVAAARKLAFVDIDLIDGLSADAAGVGFLRSQFGARGLLSSKSAVVKAATQTGMVAIHRHFMIDSMAFHSLSRLIRQADPDAVEILPGRASERQDGAAGLWPHRPAHDVVPKNGEDHTQAEGDSA